MPATKPRMRGDIALVELDQEAVVYDPVSGLMHYLNPMASLVLQLCDGTATVKETTADLAEANEVEPAAIDADIRRLVKQFRDAGLVVPSAGATKLLEAASEASDERKIVRREVPRNDWTDKLNHLGWVAHRSYEVADVQFGVRTNSEGVAEWLDETFGEFEVDDETAPYYSIVFGASENGNVGSSFHILYEESRALVRTLDLRAVAQVLVGQFEHVAAAERDDAVFLDSAAVMLGDVLAIVPPIIPPYLANLSRRKIDRTGLKLPGTTYVALELDSGRLIPTSPTLDLPADAPDKLAELAPHKRQEELARVEEPRSADLVVFIGLGEEPIQPYSPARAVHVLGTRILNIEQVGGRGLETVAAAVRQAPAYEMRSTNVDDTLGTLVKLLSAPPSA